MKKEYFVIIFLIIVIGLGTDYMRYQNNVVAEQKRTVEQFSAQIDGIAKNIIDERAKIADLEFRLDVLDSKINQYLEAENRKCDGNTVNCLDDLLAKLNPTVQKCDIISDGVCPKFCGLSLDIDCCREKGFTWISGQGCYS